MIPIIERQEVEKGRDIAVFRKFSIEDFVKFCLSLLLYIGPLTEKKGKKM